MRTGKYVTKSVRPILSAGILLAVLLAPYGLAQNETSTPATARKDLGPPGKMVIEYLEYTDSDLPDVIRSLAKFSGLNVMVGQDVKGKVSCHFEKIAVKDALESILVTNGYGYIVTGDVVQIRKAADLGEEKVEMVTQVFILQYLSASEVEESLGTLFSGSQGGGGGSGGGKSITASPSANAIIVNDTPGRVAEIARLIKEIDRKSKQVMIDAKLVEVGYDFSRSVGIDWGAFHGSSPEDRVDVNLGNTTDAMSGLVGQAMQWQFGIVRNSFDIQAFVQLQDDVNDLRILANPRILALHNRSAIIKITDEQPYIQESVSQGVITQSVQYQTTGIVLEVTPRINDDGYVTMIVKPSQRIAGPTVFLQGSSAFSVDERSAQTELILRDGQTAVIGGLRRQDMQKVLRKVPFFGDIPILGLAFRRTEDKVKESELLLFITPHIVTESNLITDTESSRLSEFKDVNIQVDQSKKKFAEDLEKNRVRIERKEAFKREYLEKKEAREAEENETDQE